MPKQLYKITQFHGGLNSNSDARDIAENELSEATDVMVDELGKIRMMGATSTSSMPAAHAANITAGYGLFQFSADRLGASTTGSAQAETGDDYLAMADAVNSEIDIYSRVAGAWGTDRVDLGSTANVKAAFYFIDGALRVSDGNFGGGNTPQWFGYVDRQFFGNGTSGFNVGGNFTAGKGVDKWIKDGAAPLAIAIQDVAGETGSYDVDSPDASSPVAVQIRATSNANNYVDCTVASNAISSTVKVKVNGTFATADNSFSTNIAGNGDWDVDNFCSVGDRIWVQAAVDADNDQTLFTVTDVNAGSQNILKFAEDVTAETNDEVYLINLSRTTWFDTIKSGMAIGVTALYGDEKQESRIVYDTLNFYEIMDEATVSLYPDEIGFEFSVFVGDGSSTGIWATDPRVSGFNVYVRTGVAGTTVGSDWYLYGTVDISEGARMVDSNIFRMWGSANLGGTLGTDTATCIISPRSSPTTLITYKDNTGFDAPVQGSGGVREVGFSAAGTGWKTAVVTNRRAYVGNVTIKDANNNLRHYGDAILKSPVNKFDSFMIENRLEATIRDGDEIVKLEEYADRLLEFKKKKMTLINISQDIEFVEETFLHKGVAIPAATCKTDFGIAWVNELGCYLYDGQKVNNLLEKGGRQIIKESEWSDFVNDPVIGYIPKKRQLLVSQDDGVTGSGKAFLYDLVTQSWVKGAPSTFPVTDGGDLKTNFVTDWNNDLIWAYDTGVGTVVKWDDTAASSTAVDIKTKDIDFGQPAQTKRIYKFYVTHRGSASNIQLSYATNGDQDTYTEAGSELPVTSAVTDWVTTAITPTTFSCTSVRLRLFTTSGDTTPANFEINDITIVYRVKGQR